MRVNPWICAGAVVISTSGCTTIGMAPVSRPDLPAADDKELACAADACTSLEARRAVSAALNYCARLSEYYDRNGGVTTGQRLFIGVAGALAGSVFAITAGGAAAKAWSGFSGAANGLQTQLDTASDRIGNTSRQRKISELVDAAKSRLTPDLVQNRPNDAVLQSRFLVSGCATSASAVSPAAAAASQPL